jgi:hypothetical protein
MKLRRSPGLTAGLLALGLLTAGTAEAAGPATVSLRVEGATKTIYEGTLTTNAKTIHMGPGENFGGTTYPGGDEPCLGTNGGNQGGYSGPGATPNTALDDAAATGAFSWYGPYDSSYGDFFVDTIAGEGSVNGPYWDLRVNGASAQRGGCQIELGNGDEVLYAIDAYGKPGLKLSGPAKAAPGQAITAKVTDGETGAPVAGASVGGATSAADGGVTVGPFSVRGDHDVKATKAGTVRSNRLRVCVTDGSDGACGTTVPTPQQPSSCTTTGHDGLCGTTDTTKPVARLVGLKDSKRYSRRRAPRTLRGTVTADPSGIRAVQLRLKGRRGRDCTKYSASRETWGKRSCWRNAPWFTVGEAETWRYLLPARLRPGRYTIDVRATDKAGNRSALRRGTSRIVIAVR